MIFAEYPNGIAAGGVVVGRQTVVQVQTVRVRVYADEGSVLDRRIEEAGEIQDAVLRDIAHIFFGERNQFGGRRREENRTDVFPQ